MFAHLSVEIHWLTPHSSPKSEHHPKSFEIIRAENCTTSRRNKTGNWIVFNPKGPGSTPTLAPYNGGGIGVYPKVVGVNSSYCTPEAPCPQCYGDCDTDDDCQGHLQCYQRNGGQKVPSCSEGEGVLSGREFHCAFIVNKTSQSANRSTLFSLLISGTDFCIDPSLLETMPSTLPPDLSRTKIPEIERLGVDYCSETNKCGLCQGDCDTNDDCKEGLICFQRNANEDIPGCAGIDGSSKCTLTQGPL